jgi:carbohydrate-selective porin OprB
MCCADAVTLDVVYTSDAFSNTRGGIDAGTGYSGLLDVVLRTDLEALGFEIIGGSFVLHGQNKTGPGLGPYTGATQSTNIDADPFTAMAEYFWERELSDGLAIVRIGRQVGAIQFSVLDLAADFTYGGFQLSPNNPLPWYPNPTLAATVNIDLTERVNLAFGSFAGGPPDQLTSWGWSNEGKVYTVGQIRYSYDRCGLPGDVQTGIWYTSGSHEDVADNNDVHGNHGVYFGWDQLLWSERCDPEQGLGTFFIYSWAPQDRNVVTNHVATGVVYRGLLRNRAADVTGVGLGIADFSNDLAGRETERIVEFFHKVQVTATTIVQPALYYISHPGGVEEDSLVVGIRVGFEL